MNSKNSLLLKSKFKNVYTQFSQQIKNLVSEVEELRQYQTVFMEFGQECVEVEDRLKDVLEQKTMILSEYEILKKKVKEKCKNCSQIEAKLEKESRKRKQYEFKMKNIARVLQVNTVANTHEGNAFNLMADFVSTNKSQSQEQPESQETMFPAISKDEQKEEIDQPEINNKKETGSMDLIGDEPLRSSRVLVNEKEDDEYFETTTKKNSDVEILVEVPETICEEYPTGDYYKRPPEEELSPTNQTPNKRRRKLSTKENNNDVQTKNISHLNIRDQNTNSNSNSPLLLTNVRAQSSTQETISLKKMTDNVKKLELDENCTNASNKDKNKELSKCKLVMSETRHDNDETKIVFKIKEDKVQKKEETDIFNSRKEKWKNIIDSSDDDNAFEPKKAKDKSFTKPNSHQWKLKVSNSSVNKSKLKQTKLVLEKKIEKIDISEIKDFSEGIAPNNFVLDKGVENKKKLIIEETQEYDGDNEVEFNDNQSPHYTQECNKKTEQSFSQMTLPDESFFLPNAVSTQKIKTSNININKEMDINSRKLSKDINNDIKEALTPQKVNFNIKHRTEQNSFRKPSASVTHSKLKESSIIPRSNQALNNKALFLPKESVMLNKIIDYTSKWVCPGCIDYFTSSYGMDILKKRPPPKKCGHKNKYPATPPDFWDPMCS